VATLAPDSDDAKRIDAALKAWRQGDLALEESWFVHVGDPAAPLSETAAEPRGRTPSTYVGDGRARRSHPDLRHRSHLHRATVHRGRPPDAGQRGAPARSTEWAPPVHATLPSLVEASLVADLDRVMTVEKSIVASWKRTAATRVTQTVVPSLRHSPASESGLHSPMTSRPSQEAASAPTGQAGKSTDEGRGLRALREIRVHASPTWEAPKSSSSSGSSART